MCANLFSIRIVWVFFIIVSICTTREDSSGKLFQSIRSLFIGICIFVVSFFRELRSKMMKSSHDVTENPYTITFGRYVSCNLFRDDSVPHINIILKFVTNESQSSPKVPLLHTFVFNTT